MTEPEELYKHFLSCTGVSTDSRKLAEGNMFFALKGENFDGNIYAGKALEKGARLAVIDNKKYAGDSRCFLVKDSLQSLQQLATLHRKQFAIPLIGLTGSNGKTTTKELIHKVLSKKFRVQATHGNLNNHIGVPLTLLGIDKNTEIVVVEMGANHIGEIKFLCQMAKPAYGLITNIGKAHLEGFGSYEGVVKAKTELYDHLKKYEGTAFVNSGDPLLLKHARPLKIITYGNDTASDVQARIIKKTPFLEIEWNGNNIPSKLYGAFNFENMAAAICIGHYFKVDENDIVQALSSYQPDNSRSQLIKSGQNIIYLDAYNANPSSMLLSINNFEEQESGNKVLILGDMLELGKVSQKEHAKVIEHIKGRFRDIILVGQEFFKAACNSGIKAFHDTDSASEYLKNHPVRGARILIKGSRGIALERLLEHL
ncbi:MAG: UDP-N-acetylmuramoyl-tripeptide--D-alanyl-D-alanine ligase [Bacteroidales bacterium]|nr:UDP-N-acetylmuramoyl-tripeptide--D-alanyl-D-alanine ligase [Bacteroidales bacterium]